MQFKSKKSIICQMTCMSPAWVCTRSPSRYPRAVQPALWPPHPPPHPPVSRHHPHPPPHPPVSRHHPHHPPHPPVSRHHPAPLHGLTPDDYKPCCTSPTFCRLGGIRPEIGIDNCFSELRRVSSSFSGSEPNLFVFLLFVLQT